MYTKKAESEAKAPKRAVGPGTPTPIKRHATGEASIYNAKKAEGLTSAHHRTSAATAVVSASTSATAEQEQYNDDPAGIIAVSTVITATASIVSTETHQADDPKNTAAGIISEKAGSIAASTVVVATASVIAASAVCSS